MRKSQIAILLSLLFTAWSGSAAVTMVDGVSNGVSTKYNKACLDVAYKNAYEEAGGGKTTSDDFKNYKCYKDGKEVYCNEIYEDGQTEDAKTDHFVNHLPDGLVCLDLPDSGKIYESTQTSCDDIAYKNAWCNTSGTPCDLSDYKCYQDHVAVACADVTDQTQTDKAEADYLAGVAKCSEPHTCTYGGVPDPSNTGCLCNAAPDCTGPYGGSPVGNGTQECNYLPAPNCSAVCTYGGVPAANGTQDCVCAPEPNCADPSVCAFGGTPKTDGSGACTCNEAPACGNICTYGGSPLKNGTQDCACNPEPNCNVASACPYGGTAKTDGTGQCACNGAPNCNVAAVCTYGGSPKGDGSQACSCSGAPNCSGSYGGSPKGDGTQGCNYLPAPNCNTASVCPYGGTPKGNGTQACSCYGAPTCTGTYGGYPAANGTQACIYYGAPDCNAQCQYGGTPKANGTQECNCNAGIPFTGGYYTYNVKQGFSKRVYTVEHFGYCENCSGSVNPNITIRGVKVKELYGYQKKRKSTGAVNASYTIMNLERDPDDKSDIHLIIDGVERVFVYSHTNTGGTFFKCDTLINLQGNHAITVL